VRDGGGEQLLLGEIVKAAAVKAAGEHRGTIAGLAPYRLAPAERGGLVFGYSDLEESAIRRGVELLQGALDDQPGLKGRTR
jgi:GntR family transcriptional regulator/MocR family aminotransferase